MYYALFTITGSIFLCTMQVIKILNTKKIDLDQIDYVLKYLSSAYVAVIFVRLAKRWPKLMHDWNNVEIWMRSYGFPMKLNKRIMWLIGIFTIGFLVESLLHQASRIYRAWQCHEDDAEKAIKFFFGNLSLSHVFQHINYNIPSSVILQFWIFQTEFGFMYTDLFVMVISACLHSRIKQITERINLADKKQTVHEKIWENLRRDYTKLSVLVQRVNEEISNIILVSFVPNVFTILTQVFATLKPKHNRLEAVYFYFSMIFLISRTVMVCICGSLVNEESRKPLHILNCVSHTVYNDAINNIFLWKSLRCDYVKLTRLCFLLNRKFSWLIIISYARNLECLLLDGYATINSYGSSSFAWNLCEIFLIILRVILVSFFGGALHYKNEAILVQLVTVPTRIHNKEVQRFLCHVSSKEIGFTAKNYFNVTRSLILRIANAVITYELVIIQFVEHFNNIE
ncbi:hypothetical protein ABEB36_008160 [Hypothenemus hampei]|uniref:Gustatory receptor n=1 Tax=Hypothenemus hampei TaxID=57062 RepID=A0ABD1ELI7_HYPHA